MRYERKTMAQPLPLWQHLQVVLPRFMASEWCALLLDYDGTLTPIVTDPAAALLSRAMQELWTARAHPPPSRREPSSSELARPCWRYGRPSNGIKGARCVGSWNTCA